MEEMIDVIKIGGNVIDDETSLNEFISGISQHKNPFVLIHGGGKTATSLCEKLGIKTEMIDGRRITNEETLNVVVMTYAGLVNKKVVSKLQSHRINALGLCGADGNVIKSTKRSVTKVDYGFVGDVSKDDVSAEVLSVLLHNGFIPVLSAITHDGNGQLLNTNADTIASVVASSLVEKYNVRLIYCFEKDGVMNNDILINELSVNEYEQLKKENVIHSGMIPKTDNAFRALNDGVKQVFIIHSNNISNPEYGTELVK